MSPPSDRPRFDFTRRQVLQGLGGAALLAGAGGYGAWRVAQGPPLYTLPLRELEDRPVDVCVIGSGPAGAILGLRLAEQGLRTVLLESGVPLERMSELAWNGAALDAYTVEGDPLYPLPSSRLRAVGGASNLWTGRSPRLHPLDFEPNAYTPSGAPWPLRYEDLRFHYERAEESLSVRGGALSSYHAPRSFTLPGDADEEARELMRFFAPDLDVVLDAPPTSHASLLRSGPVRTARDILPQFTASPNGRLVIDATVTRLAADPGGRIRHAEVHSTDGSRREVRAEVFVVACGGVESARTLLLSRAPGHAYGLGNRSDQLGRNFNEHPNLNFVGELPRDAPGGLLVRCHQFYDAAKDAGLGSAIYVFQTSRGKPRRLRIGASLEMLPHPANRVTLDPSRPDAFGNPGLRLTLHWSPQDLATLAATRERIAGFYAALGATQVEEEPLTWSHHHIGTCRMGDDPVTSVVDADLRVHGTPNLHVLSSAVFVTGGASHPTLTIAAFAHRLADRLLGAPPAQSPEEALARGRF